MHNRTHANRLALLDLSSVYSHIGTRALQFVPKEAAIPRRNTYLSALSSFPHANRARRISLRKLFQSVGNSPQGKDQKVSQGILDHSSRKTYEKSGEISRSQSSTSKSSRTQVSVRNYTRAVHRNGPTTKQSVCNLSDTMSCRRRFATKTNMCGPRSFNGCSARFALSKMQHSYRINARQFRPSVIDRRVSQKTRSLDAYQKASN